MKAFIEFLKKNRRILAGAGLCLLVIILATTAFLFFTTRDELNQTMQRRLQSISRNLDVRLSKTNDDCEREVEYSVDAMRKTAAVLALEPEDALNFDFVERCASCSGDLYYFALDTEYATNLLVLDGDRNVLYSLHGDDFNIGQDYRDVRYDTLFAEDAPAEVSVKYPPDEADDEGIAESKGSIDTYCTKCGDYYLLTEAIRVKDSLLDVGAEELKRGKWATALGDIWIGDDTLLAVASHETGEVLYCKQENLIGTTVDTKQFRTLVFDRIDGELYAVQAEHSPTQKVDLLALTPMQTVVNSFATTILLIAVLFLLVLVVLTAFIVCLRQGEVNPDQEYRRFGKYFLRPQVRSFCVVSAVAGIFLVFAFVTMTNLNEETRKSQQIQVDVKEAVSSIDGFLSMEKALERDNSDRFYRLGVLTSTYLKEHPDYMTKRGLGDLAEAMDVKYLTVFDANGKTLCTSSSLDHLSILSDKRSPLYELRYVLVGKETMCVQGDRNLMDEEDVLYAAARENAEGIADGFVAVTTMEGMTNREFRDQEYGSETTEKGAALELERDEEGSFFFVLNADGTVLLHPEEEAVGKSTEELGIPEEMVVTEESSGRITLGGIDYLVATAKSEESGCHAFLAAPIVRLTSASLWRAAVILILYLGLVCWILYDELGSWEHFERRESIRSENTATVTTGLPWSDLPTEQKMGRVLRVCTYLFSAYLILLWILLQNGVVPPTGLAYILEGNWQKSVNFYSVVGNLCLVCLTYSMVNWVSAILHAIAKAAGQHGKTICRLIANLLKYVGVFFCLYYALMNFGMNPRATLASAGIAAIALTLGAQDLIRDMIAGMFIMLEGNFKVGDKLEYDDEVYIVKTIGVRTTILESCGVRTYGKKKIINNSEMCGIINVQNARAKVKCDVQIGNQHDLDRIKEIFDRELPSLRGHYPKGTSGPVYKGVKDLSSAGTTIRLQCVCPSVNSSKVGRTMRMDVKRILDLYGIELPLTGYIIHTPTEGAEETGVQETDVSQ